MAPSEPCAPRPLAVAVVTETYPPEVNGVATTIARVVDGLRGRGHRVELVRPRQPEDAAATADPDLLLVPGWPIPRYPQLRMGLPASRALAQRWSVRRPDVVHVVTAGPLGWSALNAARRLGLPLVSDFRTNFHAYSAHYGLGALRTAVTAYLRGFHNRCACTMVPTEAVRRELAAAGFERLRVVARGVDTALFHPARRSDALRAVWGAAADTMVALYVGRLAPEKNLDALAAAHDAMSAHDRRLRLVIVGDGPGRDALRQRCPDAVHLGLRQGAALAACYASADLLLFPSVTETYGNVVPEAMASGIGVVAFDTAAAGLLVRHGESGLLAPVDGSPQQAAARWCALACSVAGDLPRVRGWGAAARATACGLDWQGVVGEVEAEYRLAAAQAALAAAGLQRDLVESLTARFGGRHPVG